MAERRHDVHFAHKVLLGFGRGSIFQNFYSDNLLRVSIVPLACKIFIMKYLILSSDNSMKLILRETSILKNYERNLFPDVITP